MNRIVVDGLELPLGERRLRAEFTCEARVAALYGPSGAGKTSLLEWIAGLRHATTGRLEIGGTVLADAATGVHVPPQSRKMGYVPQDGALFPHLSVRDNLLYGYRRVVDRLPELTFEHITSVLEIGGLSERSVRSLSGGERQRVALGRALLAQARLLLLDEPFASLDSSLKLRLLPYLGRVRDEFGVSMLYVTHDPDEIMALCDCVIPVDGGVAGPSCAPGLLFEPSRRPRYERRAGA